MEAALLGRLLKLAAEQIQFSPRMRSIEPRSFFRRTIVPHAPSRPEASMPYRKYLEDYLDENLPARWTHLGRYEDASLLDLESGACFLLRWSGTDITDRGIIDTVDVVVVSTAALNKLPDDKAREDTEEMIDILLEDNCTLIAGVFVEDRSTLDGSEFEYMSATIRCESARDVRGAFSS